MNGKAWIRSRRLFLYVLPIVQERRLETNGDLPRNWEIHKSLSTAFHSWCSGISYRPDENCRHLALTFLITRGECLPVPFSAKSGALGEPQKKSKPRERGA